jgi:RNA polymerase sigma-70 factor (ECF subfamily)
LGQLKPPQRGVSPHPALRLVGPAQLAQPDDTALVAALAAREEWAARTTWSRYAPMVYGLLDRALGSAGESEDLAQEVFLRVFAAIKTLRDPMALRSFIYSTAIRMLRWHLRTKRIRRLLTLSDSGMVPDRPSPFTLRHIEGLRLEEVATATGTSLATVKRRVRRASKRVAAMAKGDPDLFAYFVRGGARNDP